MIFSTFSSLKTIFDDVLMRLYSLIDQTSSNEIENSNQHKTFDIYKNKQSKLNESILVHYNIEQGYYSLHIYAIILIEDNLTPYTNGVIDLRKEFRKEMKSPLKVIASQKRGSLSFIRYFVKDSAELEYEQKMKEKYPNKKNPKKSKYFPPLLLLVAHYCDKFYIPDELTSQISQITKNSIMHFDNLIQDEIHLVLRTLGKPIYLKGENSLLNFHLLRELPENIIKKLTDEEILIPIHKLKPYSKLIPIVKNARKETQEQELLLLETVKPEAISHVYTTKNEFLPLYEERFPLIVVGEPKARRNLILNVLKNANARFLILDPKENYGRLAMTNPRIRGYLLGANYLLNIINTEGSKIREQVYAYWFAKIIASISGLRNDFAKTIETYLLGAYRDPQNRTKAVFQFRDFANQELTSEVTKMGRAESNTITNVLYPLGTYDEISLYTRIDRSLSFDSLFDTKGAIIQFAKNDDQLTKIAYLFTVLKLLSVQNYDPKIIVLDNIDEIFAQNYKSRQDNDLTDLISSLAEEYYVILGARSPSKIQELFKNTRSKFINRLLIKADWNLLINEFNLSKTDTLNISKLSEKEYFTLVPEFSTGKFVKICAEPDTKMRLEIDNLIKESNIRIIKSNDFIRAEGIPPEIRKAIFDIIKILREKPKKMFPEEGIESLISGCAEMDILRAKEIARNESFVKIVQSSPDDSQETINLLVLTERGDEYYKSYLKLKKQIPMITIKSPASEKNFEKDIFTMLGEVDTLFEMGDNISAINQMLEITVRLLGALPENDRFVNGKDAAKLLDQWSYLSSLKEVGNVGKARRISQEFSQIVTNVLKSIKHSLVKIDDIVKDKKKSRKINMSEKKISKTDVDEDFEYRFDVKSEPKSSSDKQDPWKKQVELNSESSNTKGKDKDSSLFLAATDDLKSAGLPHLDSTGDFYIPKKSNIFEEDSDDTSTIFEPTTTGEGKGKKSSKTQKQKSKLDRIKKKLMNKLAEYLEVPVIDDEEFIWHCLDTRFNGAIDDGYVISDIVSTLKQLYKDNNNNALISEGALSKLDKLLKNPKLLPDSLAIDLKEYIQDF